jgi:hypothetical protein
VGDDAATSFTANTGTGEVVLRLTVGAHMRSVKGDVVTEEPRIVNVDISAQ